MRGTKLGASVQLSGGKNKACGCIQDREVQDKSTQRVSAAGLGERLGYKVTIEALSPDTSQPLRTRQPDRIANPLVSGHRGR